LISSELNSIPELYARVASGDHQAFAEIHTLYKVPLLYYGRRFSLEWHEAEDLVAEAFLALWRSRETMQSDTHIRNFLFITVRNNAINLAATKKRHESILERYAPTQDTTDTALSADIIETEMLRLLHQAINTLPTECKRIFELAYHHEHSPKEIARLLDMNPATVRSQKRRAIQLIQQWIRKNTTTSSTLLALLTPTFYFLEKFLPALCTLTLLVCN
jgi:RNA polymerase sigma-70 factor (ECF subfamily)